MTTIKLKNGSGAPTAGDLVQGEPALDLTNKRLYTEDSVGTVIEVGTNPTSVTTGAITATSETIVSTGSNAFSSKAVGGYAIQAYQDATSADHTALDLRSDATTGTRYLIRGYNDAAGTPTEVFSVGADGTVTADGLTVDGTATISGAATAGFVTPLLAKNPSTNAASSVKIGLDAGGTTWGEIGASYNTNDPYMAFFVRSGSEKVRITDAGNVGIGTSSPSSYSANANNLVVYEAGNGGITIANGTSNEGALYFADGTSGADVARGVVYYSHATNHMGFSTDSAERMRIDSSGNVGIGTSSPTNVVGYTTTNIGAGSVGSILKMDGATSGFYHRLINNNGDLGIQADQGNAKASTNITFSVDGSEKARIDSSGNVGIGTDSPGVLLDCSGSSPTIRAVGTSASNPSLTLSSAGITAWSQTVSGSDSSLSFNKDGSERMRIDSSGNLLVGQTSESESFVNVKVVDGGQAGITTTTLTGSSASTAIRFRNGNGVVGSIVTSGSATAYNTSSDQRLKENIVNAPSASDDIDAIQVRSFDWKADGSHQKYGMVAQELQTVAPEAVTGDADSEDMMGVDYSKLVPMLVKEIQSLRARVAQLEGAN